MQPLLFYFAGKLPDSPKSSDERYWIINNFSSIMKTSSRMGRRDRSLDPV